MLWLVVAGVFYGLIMLLSAPVVDWIGKAPEIGRSIQDKLRLLDGPLAALRDMRNALLPSEAEKSIGGFDIMSIVQPAVSIVTPAIGQLVIFFGALFFMLLGHAALRHETVAKFRTRKGRLRAHQNIERDRAQSDRLSQRGGGDQSVDGRARRPDRLGGRACPIRWRGAFSLSCSTSSPTSARC